MNFFSENFEILEIIIRGLIIGGLFGWCFSKISNLKHECSLFKKCEYQYLKEAVKEIQIESYRKATREQLIQEINFLTQRILVIETQMAEREKIKE